MNIDTPARHAFKQRCYISIASAWQCYAADRVIDDVRGGQQCHFAQRHTAQRVVYALRSPARRRPTRDCESGAGDRSPPWRLHEHGARRRRRHELGDQCVLSAAGEISGTSNWCVETECAVIGGRLEYCVRRLSPRLAEAVREATRRLVELVAV